jgi:hypothetical protein
MSKISLDKKRISKYEHLIKSFFKIHENIPDDIKLCLINYLDDSISSKDRQSYHTKIIEKYNNKVFGFDDMNTYKYNIEYINRNDHSGYCSTLEWKLNKTSFIVNLFIENGCQQKYIFRGLRSPSFEENYRESTLNFVQEIMFFRLSKVLNLKKFKVVVPNVWCVFLPIYGIGSMTEYHNLDLKIHNSIIPQEIKSVIDTMDYIIYNFDRYMNNTHDHCVQSTTDPNEYIIIDNCGFHINEHTSDEPGPNMNGLPYEFIKNVLLYKHDTGTDNMMIWYEKTIDHRIQNIKIWLSYITHY